MRAWVIIALMLAGMRTDTGGMKLESGCRQINVSPAGSRK